MLHGDDYGTLHGRSRVLLHRAELYGEVHVLILVAFSVCDGRTLHGHPDRLPRHLGVENGKKVICGTDALAVHLHHDITKATATHWPHARLFCGSFRHHLHHHDTVELQLLRHHVRSEDNAQDRPPDKALGDDALHVPRHRVDGDGQAHAREGTAAREDGSVHADDLPVRVEQGSTAVPGVDGGVRLDDAVDGPAASALHLPGDAADDPPAEAVLQAEGVAESEDALTHEKVRGGASW
mmetsp:Transcript_1301/g.3962  ORF Transcript_1301/g.3962 Transcript_1301/m.3962 type:complete len:238 (+) Transcript_1301:220-933(+)